MNLQVLLTLNINARNSMIGIFPRNSSLPDLLWQVYGEEAVIKLQIIDGIINIRYILII